MEGCATGDVYISASGVYLLRADLQLPGQLPNLRAEASVRPPAIGFYNIHETSMRHEPDSRLVQSFELGSQRVHTMLRRMIAEFNAERHLV